MKMLACAVGFGLGPSGKLCSIINSNMEYEWFGCGDKIDLQIFGRNPFKSCCWSKNEQELKKFINIYNINCALVVLDQEMAILLKKLGLKVIYVDSLPFMWTKADIIPYNVDYYCAQKYPNYSKKRSVLKPIKNLIWINPIITEKNNKVYKNQKIIVNFGGLHSPYGEGKEYFKIIMNSIVKNLPAEKICITGGKNVMKLSHENFPEIECKTFSHEDFMKNVDGSDLFITSPGLTTIYESFSLNIKTVIMPPQNLSQFYNVSIAKRICKNVKIISWNDRKLSMKELGKFKMQPEEKAVEYIYNQIKILSEDEEYNKKFSNYVSNKLRANFKINNSTKFDMSGTEEVSEILKKIKEKNKNDNYGN